MAGDNSERDEVFDVAIIGAGIAGTAIAAELPSSYKILVLEMEDTPGYHTTGRSAAILSPSYGPPVVRDLTQKSQDFFQNPSKEFTESPLLRRRGLLKIATAEQLREINGNQLSNASLPDVEEWDTDKLRDEIPILRDDFQGRAWYEKDCWDIDVDILHQSYLRQLKKKGCRLICDARVEALAPLKNGWKLEINQGSFRAELVINAAGAWAGQIGEHAGATEIGLVPKRRTMVVVSAPEHVATKRLPMIVDSQENFYLKPEAGRLFLSPADETPSEPCDSQPEELDVAICIDRIEKVFDLDIRRIENQWAGLRSFVADKNPVCGFDPKVPNFFWMAALGGYGIQIIPELSRLAVRMIDAKDRENTLLTETSVLQGLSPDRFEV